MLLHMDLNFSSLLTEIDDGTLRQRLERELTTGFEAIRASGEALPLPSHYAARIAEIIERNSEQPISKAKAFDLYQEVLLAVEQARVNVLGEEAEEERKNRKY